MRSVSRRAHPLGTVLAPPAAMHAIFFGLKRAWHGCLRITRRTLAAMGLTAARFDLLYALRKDLSCTQRELRLMLGVNRTTISRMLCSLEALGLITRRPVRRRGHLTREVELTAQGRRRIGLAVRNLIDSGAAKLAVDSAIAGSPQQGTPSQGWCDDMASLHACEVMDSYLRAIRHAYRDSATLYYRWHPDD